MQRLKTYFYPLGFFILAAVGSRWPAFFNYLDKDEGTYITIGQELNADKQLYLEIIDLKPPLGLWIYQGMEALFDAHIFYYRLVLAILIAVLAWMLFLIQRRMGGSQLAAWLTGVLFIFLHNFQFALTFNFEFIMNFFTVLGMLLYVRFGRKFLAGLSVGLAFCVKYLCLLDFVALVFLMLWDEKDRCKNGQWQTAGKAILWSGMGFALPFFLVNLYFYSGDMWQEFRFISYIAPGNYSSTTSFFDKTAFILKFHLTHIFYFVLFYTALFTKSAGLRPKAFYLLWFLTAIMATQLTGQQFKHYLLQTMPPLALMAGSVADSRLRWIKNFFMQYTHNDALNKKATILTIVLFLMVTIFNYFDHYREKSPVFRVGEYLNEHLKPEDQLYTANCCAYLYSKCDRSPLNEYVHGTLIVKDVHIRTLEINVEKEISAICKKRPRYIVMKNDYRWPSFNKFLLENYKQVLAVKRGYKVFERLSDDAN